MSDFVIQEVLGQEEFTTANGQFIAYTVRFDGSQGKGVAQHKRKASSPAPTVGETIDAEIVQNRGKSELKRIWTGAGQGGGGGGGKSFGKSPEESARIARMNSHAHALKYWELKHAGDPAFGFASWADYTKVVDLFFNDVLGTKA